MTYEEAIETIKIAQAEVEWEYPMDYAVAFDMALQAMQLQVAKKVTTMEGGCGAKFPICPSCEGLLTDVEVGFERCCECGQLLDAESLDWSEE